jgi:hypothetical protein
MSSAEDYVLPKPGIPKTLGILNIIFGVILVLVGLCVVGFTLMVPMGLKMAEVAQKQLQAKEADQRKVQQKNLDDQIAAASTDEEKKLIEALKAKLTSAPTVEPPDMSAVTDMYKNPTIMGFNIVLYGTGVVMSLILLIAGIGLIRLKPWGRTLALWLAGIQIVRLALLTATSIIVVQPESLKVTNTMLNNLDKQMKAQAKGQAAPPNMAQSLEMQKAMAAMGSIFAVGYFVCGSIYPIVTLILLNTAGARAACQARKSPDTPDFLS